MLLFILFFIYATATAMRYSYDQHLKQHNGYQNRDFRDFRGYFPTHSAQTTSKSNMSN